MRLFVAVDPGEQVRAALTPALDTWRRAWDLRWVPPENLHVTLSFLGDRPDDDLAGLCEALQEAVRERRASDVRCGGLGFFPDRRRPRVLFLHLEDDGGLADLAAAVSDAVAVRNGGTAAPEKAFRAHLTLARFRRDPEPDVAETLRSVPLPRLPAFTADAVRLMESRLRPEGPEYLERARFPLARGGAA